jgi:AcrR family transcriptional regulator
MTATPLQAVRPPLRPLARGGPALHKGQQTKQVIVDAALGLATRIGLEGLSIGALADVTHMSKSGVFAHFGSREELQISVIRAYYDRFAAEVFTPAMAHARGLPRLRALFEHWMQRVAQEIQSGCIFISGAVEFDDRPGVVRDALASAIQAWLAALHRAVVQAQVEGHISPDTDAAQMVFEIHGLILSAHYDARFLKNPGATERATTGFEHILARYGHPIPKTSMPERAASPQSTSTPQE